VSATFPPTWRRLAAIGLAAIASTAFAADDTAAKALAEKHLCLSCHKVDARLVGPGFIEIARKYKGDAEALDKLAAKVKKGGRGVWGTIPMPANKDLGDDDIRTLVGWVLALDGRP
jgi:cytochrome c